jgi:hypothetical protein
MFEIGHMPRLAFCFSEGRKTKQCKIEDSGAFWRPNLLV